MGDVDTNVENCITTKNYINATNLFDLPHALVSYEAVRIVIGDLYNVYGDLLLHCRRRATMIEKVSSLNLAQCIGNIKYRCIFANDYITEITNDY